MSREQIEEPSAGLNPSQRANPADFGLARQQRQSLFGVLASPFTKARQGRLAPLGQEHRAARPDAFGVARTKLNNGVIHLVVMGDRGDLRICNDIERSVNVCIVQRG